MTAFDSVWRDVHVATASSGDGAYGVIENAAVGLRDGKVAWVGAETDLDGARVGEAPVHGGGGRWLTAGLVDCHTHVVFGGTRAEEFERLLSGERYEEIAASGGGIRSTVRATRRSTEEALFADAARRVGVMVRGGTTTIEAKSGYGLDVETELLMLRVARRLDAELPATVQPTLLAAHAVPPEFDGDADGYVDYVVGEMIPAVVEAGLASQIDAFVETIAFTVEQGARVLEAGAEGGLQVRVHADQLSSSGGAELAARLGARSADHVEYSGPQAIRAMADAGVTAVLLPGAFYTLGDALRDSQRPDLSSMREEGVAMAVATDLNPGSSPMHSLTAAMNMACTLFGLRPDEALAGVTRVASQVLGLGDRGAIAPGLRADLALWPVNHPRELSYWVGGITPDLVMVAGQSLHDGAPIDDRSGPT